ncbi:MAG: cell division protein FtsZ [Candidatus Micrarchaeota archaeon]|nr:cell division protein FtsZ [Candidatus Micrarchaeota archaeon]
MEEKPVTKSDEIDEIIKQSSGSLDEDEEELLKLIEEEQEKIYVVGAGGSGSNTINRLYQMKPEGVTLIAANTDARHLLKIKAHRKILLGKQLTRGRGCGSNPECGEKAAQETAPKIKEAIADADLVFLTCGMGGGTGTGALPVIAKIAKQDIGALTVGVVTLPFSAEGKVRYDNAIGGIKKLKSNVDTLIIIKNDKLLDIASDLPLEKAFRISDEVLASSVKNIAELSTKAGLVSVDFADLQTVLKNAGYAVIAVGESALEGSKEERAKLAIETALSSPLLDVDISTADRVLINIIGGEDLTLQEVHYIVEETRKRVSPSAHIIYGARIEEDMKKSSIKVLVVLAGVTMSEFSEGPEAGKITLDLDEVDKIG